MAKKAKQKKSVKKSPKKPAKAPAKKPAKKAPAKKPAKKAPAKKPAKRAPAIKAPPIVELPEPAEPVTHEAPGDADIEHGPTVTELAGKAMIIDILGDAEAYFFDFTQLSPARRSELIEHHLAAFDQRKRNEGSDNWVDQFVPIALLGESMPPPIRGQFDLSAPHEGVLLHHAGTGAVLYAPSKDDDKLAVVAPDLGTISPRESFLADVFDPDAQSYAYAVDRSQSQGFTLGEIETLMQTVGAELTLV
jgi:hypothetical protein